MVYNRRSWTDEQLQNPQTAKITQFSQQTTATIRNTDEHSSYQLLKDYYDSTSNQKLIRHRSSRGQMRSRAGVAILAPDFDKFVTE